MIFKVKKGKTMTRKTFIAICKKSLAEAWHLDVNDIELVNLSAVVGFYQYRAIFVASKNNQADCIATAISGVNPFDDKSIEFNIYKQTDCFMS